MATITISKTEYRELLDKKLRYEYLRQILEADIFSPPPTRSIKAIISNFKSLNKYNKSFLGGLERGLKRSSYFKP